MLERTTGLPAHAIDNQENCHDGVRFMTMLISFLALTSAGVFAAHIIDALNEAANDAS